MASFTRYCWVSPISFAGIVLIPLVILSGGSARIEAGLIEAEGGILPFLLSHLHPQFPIYAITIGHVVIGQEHESLRRCREHECVHVLQYERWGIFFPFLYILSSLIALAKGLDPYRDNWFEQEAFRISDARNTV